VSESRTTKEQLAAEYGALAQLLEDVRRRVDILNTTLAEISAAKSALEEVSSLSEGEELLVPVGAGVFVRAKLAGKDKVLVTLGANIMVEKALEDTRKYLEEREQKVRDALQKSVADYQALVSRLRDIEQRLRSA
jgi:prefoldin alpha subunit